MKRFVLGMVLGIVVGVGSVIGVLWYLKLMAKPPMPQPLSPPEQRLVAMLANSVLEGFTMSLSGTAADVSADQYSVTSVEKMGPDRWKMVAKVLGMVPIPMELEVKWAGDTPVITLSNLDVGILGTYSARVLLFEDHYSGVWTGNGKGGYVWGQIKHPGATSRPASGPK